MEPKINEVIKQLNNFDASSQEWDVLQQILDDLFVSEQADMGVEALFSIFERFPEEDGCGVFWSILHGIESMVGYETKLIESINRKPTHFTVSMVNRILNGNQFYVGKVSLIEILKNVSKNPNVSQSVKEDAIRYLEIHVE